MKVNTFLLTFFLITYSLSAKTFSNITTDPVMPTLPDIVLCDTDFNTQDGSTTFNITIQTPIILASQTLPASNYTVSYYSSQAAANGNVSQIINQTTFLASPLLPPTSRIEEMKEWIRLDVLL